MRLFELFEADNSTLLTDLVAAIGQLKSSIDDGQEKADWTVDELLDYLKKNDIIIDKADFFSMIKGPPLNNSIKNIQGDNVIFKGQEEEEYGGDPDKNKETVKKMAHSAAKK